MKFQKKHKGFTLIELLVVVAIIGVLATIVLSALSESRIRARETKYIAELSQLQRAFELYHLDNGEYPDGYDIDSAGRVNVDADSTGTSSDYNQFKILLSGYVSDIPMSPSDFSSTDTWTYDASSGGSGLAYCQPNGSDNQDYIIAFSTLAKQFDPYYTHTYASPAGTDIYFHCMRSPN